jgi:Protein of unknown function (DUF3024)
VYYPTPPHARFIEHAVAKATHVCASGRRPVFWQRQDLKWHRYDPAPEVAAIEDFLGLVREDRHACFLRLGPPQAMPRTFPLLVTAACSYVLAWFLPVLGDYVGWQAFRIALSSIWPYQGFVGGSLYISAVDILSALTNVAFVVCLVGLVARWRMKRSFVVSLLAAAAALDVSWFVSMGDDRGKLRIGYYLWVCSFIVLALGAYWRTRNTTKVTMDAR